MKVRRPAVAGSWYAGTSQSLRAELESCFLHKLGPGKLPKVKEKGPRNIVGLVCPHAGYMFSGPVVANAYYSLASDGRPDTVVLFGPNHYGLGSALAIMNKGAWRTPLGEIEIDTQTADQILRGSRIIVVDDTAHAR